MKHPFRTLGAAFLGSTIGYVVHQIRARQSLPAEGEAERQITVGAPIANVAAACVVGVLAGRRGYIAAFLVGVGLSAALGAQLDARIPALIGTRRHGGSDS